MKKNMAQGFDGSFDRTCKSIPKRTNRAYRRMILPLLLAVVRLTSPAAPVECVPVPAGIVAWWPGDGDAKDLRGGHHGTIVGGVTFTNGEVGQAFNLNGNGGYVLVPAASDFNGGLASGFTVEGWIKPVGLNDQPIVEWNNCKALGVHLWIVQGKLSVNIVDSKGVGHVLLSPGGQLAARTFQHVAFTYEKRTGLVFLYINGAPAAQQNFGALIPQTSYDLYLGRRPSGPGNSFSGMLDDFSIYNRALSAAEIRAIHDSGSAGKCQKTALGQFFASAFGKQDKPAETTEPAKTNAATPAKSNAPPVTPNVGKGSAPVFFQNGTGLMSPSQKINFTEVRLDRNASVTTEYQPYGITFTPNVIYSPNFNRNFSTPNVDPAATIGNFIPRARGSGPLPWFSMHFTAPVTSAAFSVQSQPGNIEVAVLLNGTEVPGGHHTFAGGMGPAFANNFLGLESGVFDEIKIVNVQTPNRVLVIGQVQFTASSAQASTAVTNIALLSGNPDILIADFEGAGYGAWVAMGSAFGSGPAHGSLPNQDNVTGFLGHGFANSYNPEGKATTGTLTSPTFKIERKFINFLIGAGLGDKKCMNLLVNSNVVRSATGLPDSQQMVSKSWDVSEWLGQTAQIQIVHSPTEGWGHVTVDQIVQSDKTQPVAETSGGGKPAAPPSAAKLRLDEFTHALDVQLADKLGASKLFKVLEDRDMKEALRTAAGSAADTTATRRNLAIVSVNYVPTLANRFGLPPTTLAYDLKNIATLEQFKNAGIGFLLITTVEDLDENHIEGETITRDFEYANGMKTGSWVEDLQASVSSDGVVSHRTSASQSSSAWRRESVHVNPMTLKEQSLRVTLRSRLYDATTGELLGSRNKTYARGRTYRASARGNNELSMGDMYQTAAADLADWQRLIVEDDAFPIKIVKIEDDSVMINRGSESGVRQNSFYDVWIKVGFIKDPDTGEILGIEEKKVGKVLIRELQTKFAKASIFKDNGIKLGAMLRWVSE